jgi:hypothetical protein
VYSLLAIPGALPLPSPHPIPAQPPHCLLRLVFPDRHKETKGKLSALTAKRMNTWCFLRSLILRCIVIELFEQFVMRSVCHSVASKSDNASVVMRHCESCPLNGVSCQLGKVHVLGYRKPCATHAMLGVDVLLPYLCAFACRGPCSVLALKALVGWFLALAGFLTRESSTVPGRILSSKDYWLYTSNSSGCARVTP